MKKYSLAFSLCILTVVFAAFTTPSRYSEAKTQSFVNRASGRAEESPAAKYSIPSKTSPRFKTDQFARNISPHNSIGRSVLSSNPAPTVSINTRPSNFYLSFPLPNRTAYTAIINSVFDHYSPNGYYHPDNKIITFTGETGQLNPNSFNGVGVKDFGFGMLYGFTNSTVAYPFVVNGNYGDTHLFYDSHDGIDFKTTDQGNGKIDVLAAADGDLTCVPNSVYNTVYINHNNGFRTEYLHMSTRNCGLGHVMRGQVIGTAGGVGAGGDSNIHLHFSVIFNDGVHGDQIVDPYGWQGQYQDPRLAATGVENTNLWKPQAYTATLLTDNHVRWHPDGSLLSSITDSNHTVWLIQGGKKRGIRSLDIFRAYGFDFANVINVSPDELDCFPDGGMLEMPPSPRLVNAGGTIYEITDRNRKRGFAPALPVSGREVFSGGAVFQGQGFRWDDGVPESNAGINVAGIADDPDVPVYKTPFRDGTLLALLDNSVAGQRRITQNIPVYIISNAKKRPFVSGNTFLLMGYRFEGVMTVTQDVLNSIPNGDTINELDPLLCHTLIGAGDTDFFAPTLTINTPSDEQSVNVSNVAVSGTASDLNSGNSGIASVKVNGVRASGDTTGGTGTANWSTSVTLNQGANTITVVATDGSINQNSTTKTITVNYQPSNGGSPTVTTTAAGTVTSNSATLGGFVNPSGLATNAWFEWGLDSTLSSNNNLTASQSIGSGNTGVSVYADLSGLTPNTTYYFRAVAANSAGTARGAIQSFPTQPGTGSSGCSDYALETTISNLTQPVWLGVSGSKLFSTTPGKVQVIDLSSNTLSATIPFTPYPNAYGGGIAFLNGKAYIPLGNLGSQAQVAIIDTATNTVTGYIPVGAEPYGITIYNGKLYVTHSVQWNNGSPSTVDVIDPNSNSVTASINAGVNTQDIAIVPSLNRGYAVNYVSATATIIDLGTNTASGTISLPINPRSALFAAGKIYVAGALSNSQYGQVIVIDPATNSIALRIDVGRDPTDLAVLNNRVFVTNQADRNLMVINTDTNAVMKTMAMGMIPTGVAVNPSSGKIYVANQGGPTISVVACAPPSCTYTISPASQSFAAGGGTGSVNVSAGNGCAWTATSNAGFLSVTSGSSGSGNGTVAFAVAANTGTSQRTGTITIAGQTLTVTQDPSPTPTPTPSPSPSPTPSPTSSSDTVWVEDRVPTGGTATGTEPWNWVNSNPTAYTGTQAHQSTIVAGFHNHYFYSATETLKVNAGDKLFTYVYLDPNNIPGELMLQWSDGSNWYNAYWGADNINWVGRQYIGQMPAAGQWVRLEVAASVLGLEGKTLSGMAFNAWNGRVSWDRAGKSVSQSTPTEQVWVEDSIPAGGVGLSSNDGWNWISTNPSAYSGSLAHQSSLATGFHNHYFTSATERLTINTGDKLFAYVYSDPNNPPVELMLQWSDGVRWYNAYWGADNINWVSRQYIGQMPAAGQWVRLEVDASVLGLEGKTLTGMAFNVWDGRVTWDRAGKLVPASSTNTDQVWVDDNVPVGGVLLGYLENWNWTSTNPTPFSGTLDHQSALVAGLHNHYFTSATERLTINTGDKLFAYAYIDPSNPPTELMLQWSDGSNWYNAYWGADNINWVSRQYIGQMPAAGQWVRLEVAASVLGLEGKTLSGMAFNAWNGRVSWDRAGKTVAVSRP